MSIVVNDFYAKTEARKGAEQVLIKLAALALVLNIFLAVTLFYSSSWRQTPLQFLERELGGPSFLYTMLYHVSVEQGAQTPKLAGA